MYKLNEKIKNLIPYEPISGDYRIRLDVNESPYELPDYIKEKFKAKLSEIDFNRYPDPSAMALRQAFADYYGISAELVTAGNGSDELIGLIEASFLKKGDKILVTTPDFSMYEFYASIYEVECTRHVKENFKIDIDEIIETVRKNDISAVVFSNPCNPTGQGVSAEDVRRLINSVDALVILDEAYMDFWTESLLQEVEKHDNLIILRTMSKLFGAAALRLGFAVANNTITRALSAVKSPYNVNAVSQAFGEIIYRDKELIEKRKSKIIKNTQRLAEILNEVALSTEKFKPIETKGNFFFIKTIEAKQIFDFLKKRSIIVRCFPEHLRICSGTEEENNEFAKALKEYFKGEKS